MKFLILSFGLFLSSAVLAVNSTSKVQPKSYSLKMELSLDGKKIFAPQMIVEAGKKATFSSDVSGKNTFIDVTATEGEIQNRKGIMMSFVVGHISKDGVRTIISEPQILAMENEKAQIEVGSNQSNQEMVSLSVTAQRK